MKCTGNLKVSKTQLKKKYSETDANWGFKNKAPLVQTIKDHES